MSIKFQSFVVNEIDGSYIGSVENKNIEEFCGDGILIKVSYSSLNYKDALSAIGNRGVTREYPHTPGIDASGVVVKSGSSNFKKGDEVIVTSYDLGMNTDGGFSEYIQVPSEWVVKLPNGLTLKESMIYGTAGLTAGISVSKLIELVKPNDGTIIVSGASGGVGSISVLILSKLGYNVTAITGKESAVDYLLNLGATDVIFRKEMEELGSKPLLKPQYAGAIDTVGGVILENIIKSTNPNGAITCCGNVSSINLNLTVFPFILRGVTLCGVDSQNYPMDLRIHIWNNLASSWKPESLFNGYNEISLNELNENIALILKGQLKGRTIINLELNRKNTYKLV